METELKNLVKFYSSYDAEKKCYSAVLNKETLLKLDADFIQLLNNSLLKDGPDKKKIEKNYRKLVIHFHPDHKEGFSPEIIWLEHCLSEGRNDATCFKTLSVCYQKLVEPQSFKEIKFNEISTQEDLKKWLESLKESSRTYTEHSFYESLLGLLSESRGYFDEVGQIKPKGIRALVSFLPMLFVSLGTLVFSEELFVVYVFYFVLLKGGQYAGTSSTNELQLLGQTLQKISVVTATATTTFLVRLMEMTFWGSRQFYDVSLQIGSALLTPLLTAPLQETSSTSTDEASWCQDLMVVNQRARKGVLFVTPEFKMIAAPIQSCLALLDQQFFRNWRAGGEKYRELDAFLFRMRVIEQNEEPLENKLEAVSQALKRVKKNPDVYTLGGNTALAVDRTERALRLLQDRAVFLSREGP